MAVSGEVQIAQNGTVISARELANAKPLDVAINDGLGNQLTGFDGSKPANAALSTVASSASSVVLLAANAARRGFVIYNNSNKELKVAFAATAAAGAFTVLLPARGTYESPKDSYTGVVSGIWAAVNGDAQVTELT